MNIMEQFITYAGDFEKTFGDDDWTRLRRYFADDAVYEVKSNTFGGDELRLGWNVTYTLAEQPPFVLRGRSIVRYAGDKIAYLSDVYDDAVVNADFAAWQRQTGITLDPS